MKLLLATFFVMGDPMFKDRNDAGRALADKLKQYRGKKDVVVLALVRGGIVVAYEIASALSLPLDIIIARKIGAPMNQELGIGAIAGDVSVLNEPLIRDLEISRTYVIAEIEKKKKEAREKRKIYGKETTLLDLSNKTVILVDDGIATGITMEAAIHYVRGEKAKKIVIAVPVASDHTARKFEKEVDQFVCLDVPVSMLSVGQFYENFAQVSDEEVIDYLKRSA